MKVPRDVSGDRLVALRNWVMALSDRRAVTFGSNMMVHPFTPLPVPRHNPIKVGTLHGILVEICDRRSLDLGDLLNRL